MLINNKSEDFIKSDLVSAGKNMGLSISRINTIIQEVQSCVSEWGNIADGVGIREKTIDLVSNSINQLVKL